MAATVLVTGGTGFLGSFIVDAIQEQHSKWSVSVLDVKLPDVPRNNVSYETGDVTNRASVEAIFDKARPEIVVHSAGLVPVLAHRYGREWEDRIFNVNVNGTRNVLAAAKRSGVKVFLWTGSCTAVTDDMRYEYANIDESWPTSSHSLIYGESKAAAESLVLAANDKSFATCALRPSVLFGPGDYQLVPSVHACIAKGETPFVIGKGDNLWDVTYVGNGKLGVTSIPSQMLALKPSRSQIALIPVIASVADAHVLAIENLLSAKTAAGEAIFISNEEPITFRDFCLAIWAAFGHYPLFELRIPMSIASIAGCVGELVSWITGTPTTMSRGSVLDASVVRYCNGAKARKILGYKPKIGIEEGIKISCDEYAQRRGLSATKQ